MSARAGRALAAVGLAVVVVAAIGATYLRPWQGLVPASQAAPAGPRSPVARPGSIVQADFPSASLGWVVTDSPASSSLYRTTDGGRHWQHQLDGVGGQGWSLRFFDTRHGVVYGADMRGPVLWRTADGGVHWTRTATTCVTAPALVFFVDPDHGWCLVPVATPPYSPPFAERQEVALFRTLDGGGHWSKLLATDQSQPVSGGLGDDGVKTWVWFQDRESGWVGQSTPGGHAVVYATTDGGSQWSRQELPQPPAGWGTPLAVWENWPQTPGHGGSPVFVASSIHQGPQLGSFALSGAYGYALQASFWGPPVQLPAGGIAAVSLLDRTHWWAASGSSVLTSDDAGSSWRTIGFAPAGSLFRDIAMVDAVYGWAHLFDPATCGMGLPCLGGLARTTDGGRHWSLVAPPH